MSLAVLILKNIFQPLFSHISVEAIKKVETIKVKRQAQHILDRMRKAKEIQKQKDILEVQRDLALIRSPAAGLKRPAKEMELDPDDIDEDEPEGGLTTTLPLDTSIDLSGKKTPTVLKAKRKRAKIVEEVQEDSDQEMEAN